MEIKKPKLPKIGIKRKGDAAQESTMPGDNISFAAADFSAPSIGAARIAYEDSSDGFDVNVRNAESGIRLVDQGRANPWWIREMPHEIATSLSLMSLFAMLFAAAGYATAIPFLLSGVIVYMALVIIEEKLENRIKLYVAAGIFAVLAISVIFLRKYIWGGMGIIMNGVYDNSESTQAYIYNRFGLGATADEHPVMCVRAVAVWASSVLGMLAALPPAAVRRAIGLAAAAVAMIVFAYYGIIPATFCVALIVIALVYVLARGGLLASLPVLLASLMIFGIIMLIAPGESYTISRADENFRDRFARRSAYIENQMQDGFQNETNDPFENEDEFNNETDNYSETPKWLVPLIIVLLVLAGLGGAGYMMYRRYQRRRAENRKGLDSDDPRTAIVAMFPYAIRWLKAADLDVAGRNFASLVESLRHAVSDQYSNYYSSMYVLWREAAYSDHEMAEEKRAAMKEFMNETTDMVKRDLDWRGKLRAAFKYAL